MFSANEGRRVYGEANRTGATGLGRRPFSGGAMRCAMGREDAGVTARVGQGPRGGTAGIFDAHRGRVCPHEAVGSLAAGARPAPAGPGKGWVVDAGWRSPVGGRGPGGRVGGTVGGVLVNGGGAWSGGGPGGCSLKVTGGRRGMVGGVNGTGSGRHFVHSPTGQLARVDFFISSHSPCPQSPCPVASWPPFSSLQHAGMRAIPHLGRDVIPGPGRGGKGSRWTSSRDRYISLDLFRHIGLPIGISRDLEIWTRGRVHNPSRPRFRPGEGA